MLADRWVQELHGRRHTVSEEACCQEYFSSLVANELVSRGSSESSLVFRRSMETR